MKTIGLALLAVLALSCGSNDDAPVGGRDASIPATDPLLGTWVAEIDEYEAVRMKFDGENWELADLMLLTSGDFGIRIDQGTYSLSSGTSATLRMRASSCQGVEPMKGNTLSMTFSRDGQSLSVTMGTLYLVLQAKSSPPTGMGTATIGCFAEDGTFTPHPTAPVP